MSYDLFAMETGDLLQTHGPDQCAGQHCCLHNPSNHPLASGVMKWDAGRNLMVRYCAHGLWHPDADDLAYKHRATSAAWASQCELHKCDGCCHKSTAERVQALMPDFRPHWYEVAWWSVLAFLEWVKSFFRR